MNECCEWIVWINGVKWVIACAIAFFIHSFIKWMQFIHQFREWMELIEMNWWTQPHWMNYKLYSASRLSLTSFATSIILFICIPFSDWGEKFMKQWKKWIVEMNDDEWSELNKQTKIKIKWNECGKWEQFISFNLIWDKRCGQRTNEV